LRTRFSISAGSIVITISSRFSGPVSKNLFLGIVTFITFITFLTSSDVKHVNRITRYKRYKRISVINVINATALSGWPHLSINAEGIRLA